MFPISSPKSGFTLVELAIVLMIIGLLIGGILKGQELIQNARILSFVRQNKALDAAILTFMDSYGYKPGDMPSPSTRLPNCSATPCSNAGDGDGIIGGSTGTFTNENNTAFIHLNVANLISGVDESQWAINTVANVIQTPLGGSIYIRNYATAATADYPEGMYGHWYLYRAPGAAVVMPIAVNLLGRVDLKMDDGKPWVGNAHLGSTAASCNTAQGATSYDGGNTSLCLFMIKSGF